METIYKRPWLVLAVLAAITLFFAFQLPRVKLDNNNIRFVPADDPARLTSAYIDGTFGSSIFILVGLERKYGTVLDGPFLNRIRDYVVRIERIGMVGKVNSIVNADYLYGDGGSVFAESLLPDDFTGTEGEIAELRRRLFSWELYENALISNDLTATQILVPLNLTEENYGSSELAREYMEVRNIARSSFADMAEVYVTGIPVIASTINEAMVQDIRLMIPLVILVVIVIVFVPFRRMGATILSLVSVLIAVIWSIGAMPLFGIKLSVISTVLPVILIAMGSSYGLHVVIHYIEDRGRAGAAMTGEEHYGMVMAMIRRTGKPIFLAALTTFASFVSFCFTRVAPIREFGFFASFGVMVSFLITMTLVPAVLLIRGPAPSGESRPARGGRPPVGDGGARNSIANFFCAVVSRRSLVLCASAAVAALSAYGASKIIIDNVLVEYFSAETDIYRSDKFIREKFGGSKILSVVVEAETPEILLHPDSLAALDRLGGYLERRVPEVGNVMGFTDLIKRVNQVQNTGEDPGGIAAGPVSPDPAGLGFWDFENPGAPGDFDPAEGSGAPDSAAPDAGAWDSGGWDSATGAYTAGEQVYSIGEIAGLLDRASKAGQSRSISAAELAREFGRLVNYDGYSYYEIPQDPARYGKASKEELTDLIFSYLLLLSGDISSYANDPLEPTSVKLAVQLKTTGQEDTDRGVEEIRRFVAANFPENLRVIVGGSAIVEGSTNVLVVQSQLISVIISSIAMFVIMSVSYRSLAAGGIAIIPLSILILANFAAMGFLKIKLNLATAMISSVSIGVGIDYTIHFIEAYKHEYRLSGGAGDFLRRAYYVSGTAILVDTLSVGLGFAVLWFSNFIVLRDFGLLVCLAMMISALSGLIIVPALLGALKPKFIGT
ncbi:MAG: MMPL family transporter [Treponema sp.]|jgi:predicted RND superfamily exporter protein|nr:MMPL family transporter [Treponema sp.]